MNRNQLVILIVLVAVLGGVGRLIYKKRSNSWDDPGKRMGQSLIEDFPLNEVAEVTIKEPSGEVNLAKKDDRWSVRERGNYPANFAEVGGFLRKVWELKIIQPQNVSEAQLGRFNLLAPDTGTNAGTLVEFKGADGKVMQTLLLGKEHMRESADSSGFGGGGWPDGRYVMAGGNLATVALVKETFSNVGSKVDGWLDKTFFKVERPKRVEVEAAEGTNSWTVVRETEQGDWKLSDPKPEEELDKSKVSGLGSLLSSASFSDVVTGDKTSEEMGLDKPRTAKLTTLDGFSYELKIGATNSEGNYFVKVGVSADLPKERTPGVDEEAEKKETLDKEFNETQAKLKEKLEQENEFENWTYLVSKWTIDPLLKERKDLLAAKKVEPEAGPALEPAQDPFGSSPIKAPTRVVSEPVAIPPKPPVKAPAEALPVESPEIPDKPAVPEPKKDETPPAPSSPAEKQETPSAKPEPTPADGPTDKPGGERDE